MKKTLLTLCAFLAVSVAVNAQFRDDKSYPTAGITVAVDSAAGQKSLIIDFNTDKTGGIDALKKLKTGSVRAQNQKGVKVEVYNELGGTIQPPGNDSRINNYGSNGNYLMADSVMGIINFYSDTLEYNFWSANNNFYLPSNTIFLMDKEAGAVAGADRAFGVYPGMYKKYKVWYHFKFEGYELSSDITFDISTFDAGNTGKKAAYSLKVGIGSDNEQYTVDSIYVSGDEKKTIKVAEAIGVDFSQFSNKKVYVMLTTEGTGDAINPFKYDPVVVVDDFKTSWGLAYWVSPAAGIASSNIAIEAEEAVDNISLADNVAYFPFDLEMKNRIKDLVMTLDIESSMNPGLAPLRIQEAQSWNGTEWVKIEGATITVPEQNTETGAWSKEILTVPATKEATEKIRVILKGSVEGKELGHIYTQKFELDNGVRIYYNYQGKYAEGTNIAAVAPAPVSAYAEQGLIVVNNATEKVDIYNTAGQILKSVSAAEAAQGISMEVGTYIVSTADFSKALIIK